MSDIRILLVDDEEGVRNAIARMVDWSSVGVSLCGVAKDGEDALKKIKERHPDILLIDIRMPRKSGLEVVAEIDRHKDWIIKSIILSGHDEFKYAQKALRLGVVDYLKKPCLPQDILKAVERAKEMVIKEHELRDADYGWEERMTHKTTGHRFVDATIEYIMEHYKENITLASAAESVYLSSGYLCTLFKQYTSQSFVEYLNRVRLEKACKILKDSYLKTYEVAYEVGYKDERYFARIFKKKYGISPGKYRQEYASG